MDRRPTGETEIISTVHVALAQSIHDFLRLKARRVFKLCHFLHVLRSVEKFQNAKFAG